MKEYRSSLFASINPKPYKPQYGSISLQASNPELLQPKPPTNPLRQQKRQAQTSRPYIPNPGLLRATGEQSNNGLMKARHVGDAGDVLHADAALGLQSSETALSESGFQSPTKPEPNTQNLSLRLYL